MSSKRGGTQDDAEAHEADAEAHEDADAEAREEKAPEEDAAAERSTPDPGDESEVAPSGGRTDFAKHYPDDPRLQALLAAFDRGDYLTVRQDADAVAASAGDPAVAKAARDLRQRIEPARTASLLLLVGLALAIFVGGYFLLQHEHRASPSPPTPGTPSARP